MKNAINSTIDRAGRIVVPKAIRELAGLKPGTRLAIRFREGRVELEPEPRTVRLERQGGLLVAVPEEEGPRLTVEQVQETLDQIRNRGD